MVEFTTRTSCFTELSSSRIWRIRHEIACLECTEKCHCFEEDGNIVRGHESGR